MGSALSSHKKHGQAGTENRGPDDEGYFSGEDGKIQSPPFNGKRSKVAAPRQEMKPNRKTGVKRAPTPVAMPSGPPTSDWDEGYYSEEDTVAPPSKGKRNHNSMMGKKITPMPLPDQYRGQDHLQDPRIAHYDAESMYTGSVANEGSKPQSQLGLLLGGDTLTIEELQDLEDPDEGINNDKWKDLESSAETIRDERWNIRPDAEDEDLQQFQDDFKDYVQLDEHYTNVSRGKYSQAWDAFENNVATKAVFLKAALKAAEARFKLAAQARYKVAAQARANMEAQALADMDAQARADMEAQDLIDKKVLSKAKAWEKSAAQAAWHARCFHRRFPQYHAKCDNSADHANSHKWLGIREQWQIALDDATAAIQEQIMILKPLTRIHNALYGYDDEQGFENTVNRLTRIHNALQGYDDEQVLEDTLRKIIDMENKLAGRLKEIQQQQKTIAKELLLDPVAPVQSQEPLEVPETKPVAASQAVKMLQDVIFELEKQTPKLSNGGLRDAGSIKSSSYASNEYDQKPPPQTRSQHAQPSRQYEPYPPPPLQASSPAKSVYTRQDPKKDFQAYRTHHGDIRNKKKPDGIVLQRNKPIDKRETSGSMRGNPAGFRTDQRVRKGWGATPFTGGMPSTRTPLTGMSALSPLRTPAKGRTPSTVGLDTTPAATPATVRGAGRNTGAANQRKVYGARG